MYITPVPCPIFSGYLTYLSLPFSKVVHKSISLVPSQDFGYQDFPAVQIRLWVCLLQSCMLDCKVGGWSRLSFGSTAVINPSTQFTARLKSTFSTYAACTRVEARRIIAFGFLLLEARGTSTSPLRDHQFPHHPKHNWIVYEFFT